MDNEPSQNFEQGKFANPSMTGASFAKPTMTDKTADETQESATTQAATPQAKTGP